MELPYARNTTYAPFTEIESEDLNFMQDSIAQGLHGYKWESIEPLSDARVVAPSATYADVTATWQIQANGQIVFRLRLEENDKLRAIQVRGTDTADNLVRVGLIQAVDLATSTIATQDSTGAGAPPQNVTLDFGDGTEYQLPSGGYALVSIANSPVAAGTDPVTIFKARMYIARGSHSGL